MNKLRFEIIFWMSVLIVLTLLFVTSLKGFAIAFFFVSFLMPVVVGSSIFFNQFLIPRYLLTNRRWKFALYFLYLLIVSIYLELLVIILAFAILADYQIANLGKIAGDVYLLTIILYLVVFGKGFIEVLRTLKKKEQKIILLEEEQNKRKIEYLDVRVDRKNVRLKLADILYVESLSDYVRIHLVDEPVVVKQKISSLESSLSSDFLRIHRSFIVNLHFLTSFSREQVEIKDEKLPIGRKYQQSVKERLNQMNYSL